MRNTHTIVLLATPLLLAAQQGTIQAPVLNHKAPLATGERHDATISNERSDALTLWTEDFENGLGAWTVETPYGNVAWEWTSPVGATNSHTNLFAH